MMEKRQQKNPTLPKYSFVSLPHQKTITLLPETTNAALETNPLILTQMTCFRTHTLYMCGTPTRILTEDNGSISLLDARRGE